jgi:hypothetical protein
MKTWLQCKQQLFTKSGTFLQSKWKK